MKVGASTAQNIAQEDLKNKEAKKAAVKINQNSQKTQGNKGADINGVKSNPNAQNIKNINSSIGRLQLAQKSLDTIETDVKKYNQLSQDLKETFEKDEQDDMQEEMRKLKKGIESVLRDSNFEGSNVFSKPVKDSKDRLLFDAPKLNISLLEKDSQKFYDTLKQSQEQIKDAINTLKNQAEESSDKLANKNVMNKLSSENKQNNEADGSFLSKLGSLFRVSHDASKLSSDRVHELLS